MQREDNCENEPGRIRTQLEYRGDGEVALEKAGHGASVSLSASLS